MTPQALLLGLSHALCTAAGLLVGFVAAVYIVLPDEEKAKTGERS